MIDAATFVEAAQAHGFALYTGVPCSALKALMNYVIDAPALGYIGAASEGDAVAIAAGAALGGVGGVVLMQNSGLGNAVNPLASLVMPFRIPLLLIVTWRGDPAGTPDEPQHELMGAITPQQLELLRIPWELFPTDTATVAPALARAATHLREQRTPYALLMRPGAVAPYRLQTLSAAKPLPAVPSSAPPPAAPRVRRAELLRAIQAAVPADDLVVTTTGYTSRELYALDDRPNQLYMVGSMGCAVSIGLGLALARPERRVVVVDGDGAALMRLGALATVGYERPVNLVHIVLDNASYESTGGQASVAHSIDFGAIARACGYERVVQAATPEALSELILSPARALTFVHAPISTGTLPDLPRPARSPAEQAQRFRAVLGER